MATTHVFIVGTNTFKYHLQYLFAGTGAKDNYIDFNNNTLSILNHATENSLTGLIADFSRIRTGDFIIFYLQQDFSSSVFEGKFYGVFRVRNLFFMDNNDDEQFLKNELGKSLTFRVGIEPYQVYSLGVSEWEALDEIRNINSPNQMLWSLIYRKLKGNRGNTMITLYESERLINLIRTKNHQNQLQNYNSLTFDLLNQTIINDNNDYVYNGRQEVINLLPRLIHKHNNNRQFETHLQAYILSNIENIGIFNDEHIEWIGNEVSCGVGMQRIDIMISSINEGIRKITPIELKSTFAQIGITKQLQRYIDWLEQYYLPNKPSDIEPMIISRKISNKNTDFYQELINSFREFNNRNNHHLNIRYIEFQITENIITFNEIEY